MKHQANSTVTVAPSARLKLSEAQLARMAGLVKPDEKQGWVVTTATVQFKRGETFECDADEVAGATPMVKRERAAAPAAAPAAAAPAAAPAHGNPGGNA